MQLREANDLLDPGYTGLESGYTRLPDGQLHVAAWTTMPRCKGRKVEWWLGFPAEFLPDLYAKEAGRK